MRKSYLSDLDYACSRFREDSELSRLNAAAGMEHKVSPLLLEVLTESIRAAQITDGDVIPTLGASLVALGYDRTFTDVSSTGPAVVSCYTPVESWKAITINYERGTVTIPSSVMLDLGAVAKAWCADQIASAIAANTNTGALVNLGGDIAVAGAAPEVGWRIRISHHHDLQTESDPVISITDGAIATSSTSVRSWSRGGQRLHHLINPRTGKPVEPVWKLVSVAARTCVEANIASTGAMIKGHAANNWLDELGLPARLESYDGQVTFIANWPADSSAVDGKTPR